MNYVDQGLVNSVGDAVKVVGFVVLGLIALFILIRLSIVLWNFVKR